VATRVGETTLRAQNVVIASGSRPRRPDIIPFDDRAICDSESILQLDSIPLSLDQLASAVFNYPTLSESYRVAALDGLNRL